MSTRPLQKLYLGTLSFEKYTADAWHEVGSLHESEQMPPGHCQPFSCSRVPDADKPTRTKIHRSSRFHFLFLLSLYNLFPLAVSIFFSIIPGFCDSRTQAAAFWFGSSGYLHNLRSGSSGEQLVARDAPGEWGVQSSQSMALEVDFYSLEGSMQGA